MAQRRMLSSDVIGQETFIEMPADCHSLYMFLNQSTDDYGCVEPKGVMRMINAREDSLKLLIAKGFIIPLKNKKAVVRHWHLANKIRKERLHDCLHAEELKDLQIVGGKYYLKTKTDFCFTAWLGGVSEETVFLSDRCQTDVTPSKLSKLSNKEPENTEELKNEEGTENSVGIEKCREKMREIRESRHIK